MKNTILKPAFVAAIALTLGMASQAKATVLDFEGLGGALPDPYGLVDWEDGSWGVYEFVQPPYTPHSGTGRTFESTSDSTPSWTFTTPVVFDGAWFSGYDGTGSFDGRFNVDLYYLGVLVHSTGTFTPTETPAFLAAGYGGLVDQVVINNLGGNDFWVMDDLTYNSSTVPEPGSMALMGAGLVGLVVALRRRVQ